MDKKMYKYSISQNDNQKNNKKLKEIKLLPNYIPIKKIHVQSNISEYETEPSIQKNFSGKCQKYRQNIHPKSVQTNHSNQFSPQKESNQNNGTKNFSHVNKICKGSFYNLNNLNIYDYFSEKVVLTQKKFIEYKNKKINTLKKELSLIKKEINLYEKKNISTNSNKNNKSNNSNNSNNSSNNSSVNKNNKSQIVPKILYVNKNNNKYLLVNNNNSYISISPFFNSEIFNNAEMADKRLEKKLSNLLTENNSENNFKNKANFKNINNNENKKNLLNIMYQSKKGCFNHNNNNYDYNMNINVKNTVKNNDNKNSFKNNHLEKEIKHNLYFYTNKMNDKQVQLVEDKNIKSHIENIINIDEQYQEINDKLNKIFNCLFNYYDNSNYNQINHKK